MEPGSLAALIAELEAPIRRVLHAVRAFAGAPPPQRPAGPPAHFGEHERLAEAKYYPPAPPAAPGWGEGDLPELHGQARLVLLAVDPSLIHAYWELPPAALSHARNEAGASVRSVLRLCAESRWFDVEVDLQSRNWYVPLWSADQSCFADLGLRGHNGTFVRLARSNLVHTPRRMPVVEPGEPLAPAAAPTPHSTPARPPGDQPLPAPAQPQPEPQLASGPPKVVSPQPEIPPLYPAGAEAILKKKLEELHALRDSQQEPSRPVPLDSRHAAARRPEEPGLDMTESAENRLTPGLSSGLLQKRRPER